MPANQVLARNVPGIKIKLVAGGAAGVLALVGIKANGDRILSVVAFGLTEGTPNTFSGIVDLTAEFSIPANDQITNAGGTSTAGKLVIVHYESPPAGLVS